MDVEVLELLKKNMELAEEKLNSAPVGKIDEYLDVFISAKEAYIRYLKYSL